MKIAGLYLSFRFIWSVLLDEPLYALFSYSMSFQQFESMEEFAFLFISALFLFFYLKLHFFSEESAKFYGSAIFSHSPSAILICDVDGKIINANDSALALTEFTVDELVSRSFFSLVEGKAQKKVKVNFSNIHQESQKKNFDTYIINNEGNEVAVRLNMKRVVLNKKMQILIFIDEVSIIKNLYQRAIESDVLFSKVFNNVPFGMQIINLATELREEINPAACLILGAFQEELLNKNAISHSAWRNKQQQTEVLETLKRDGFVNGITADIINKKNQTRTIEFNLLLLKYADKDLALVSMIDVTHQTKMLKDVSIISKHIFPNDEAGFLNKTLLQIGKLFKADQAIIGKIDSTGENMETLAYCVDNQLADNITYSLLNTLCNDVTQNKMCYYPNNLQQLFPQDIFLQEQHIQSYLGVPLFDLQQKVMGGLILLFKQPTHKSEYDFNILSVFAGKISSEIQHQQLIQQQQLAEQHLNLYRIQSPMASLEWDINFNLVSCNQATEQLLGYSLEELQRFDFITELVPINEQQKVTKTCRDLMAETGGKLGVNSIITKNNKVILGEWHNTVIKDKSNTIIGALSIVKDISQETKYIQLLEEEKRDKQETLNAIIDTVITINHQGIILTANDATTTMFGYTPDELIGHNVSKLTPKSTKKRHDSYIKNYERTHEAKIIGIGRELIAVNKAKKKFPIRLSLAELTPDKEGNPRYVGTCHDLTETKQQQLVIDRALKMDALGKLTGGIAHDFNNILGVVLGYSELILQNITDNPKVVGYGEQIIKASERGSHLTQKLLTFSKKKNTDVTEFLINDKLHDMQEMLSKTLTPSVSIQYDLPDNLWLSQLDCNAFEDAILNLCINAKHALLDHGMISIQTKNVIISPIEAQKYHIAIGEYVCLSITDNGCGMSEETQKHLFEPFYTTKGDDGTGLGLSQVYGFVKASNGCINLYSELTIGTSLSLYFPRFKSEQNIANNKSLKEMPLSYSGKENILVVDDEPALSILAKTILENEGYTVEEVNSAQAAISYLSSHAVNLIISDIIMPKMNGYQLHEKLRALGNETPMIFASGFSGQENQHLSQQENIPLIHKPYNSHSLLATVREVLDANLAHSSVLNSSDDSSSH